MKKVFITVIAKISSFLSENKLHFHISVQTLPDALNTEIYCLIFVSALFGNHLT